MNYLEDAYQLLSGLELSMLGGDTVLMLNLKHSQHEYSELCIVDVLFHFPIKCFLRSRRSPWCQSLGTLVVFSDVKISLEAAKGSSFPKAT